MILVELVEIAERLEDSKKKLLIEVARGFLSDDKWSDDDLTDEDLHLITLGEQEYAEGETISHSKRSWK